MTLWIADVNPDYQKALNVPDLASEGYSALIIKATEGRTWRSKPLADQWARQARDNGLIVGAYHWLTNANVADQVDNFMSRIEALGWPNSMIIALDVESGESGNPTWDSIQGWVNEWNARTNGYPIVIYTGRWWWNTAGRRWDGSRLTPYLWHAEYVTEPGNKNLSMAGYGSTVYSHVPQAWWNTNYGGWQKATMLQFTSRGTAAGIAANVDISAFEGTIGELRTLAGITTQQPAMETEEMVMFYALTNEAAAAIGESPDAVWATNGVTRWHVPNPADMDGLETMGRAGAFPMFAGGEVQRLGVHIGHDLSADSRLAANSERILASWAQGMKPWGIRFSEDGEPLELGNPFMALADVIQQVLARPVAEITDDQILSMATTIAEHMSTSVETVATTGQALMTKLNSALAGVAGALSAATQDQAPRAMHSMPVAGYRPLTGQRGPE